MASTVVLVTGSSGGFGRLICEQALQQGHTVLATMRDPQGRNAQKAEELERRSNDAEGTLHVFDLDVVDDASVEAAIAHAIETAGQVDVLVNNAGHGAGGLTEAFTAEQLQRILDVDLVGVHRLNRAVLPHMRKRKSGLIVHISSIMGRIVIPFAAAYTAAKFALEGYAESLAYELKPLGIDVAIVQPGGFGTGFLAAMVAPDDEARIASYGSLAQMPEKVWSGFEGALSSEGAPDASDVAAAVIELIGKPAGRRPLRTVVDPMLGGGGAKEVNRTAEEAQKQLLTGFGLGDLVGS